MGTINNDFELPEIDELPDVDESFYQVAPTATTILGAADDDGSEPENTLVPDNFREEDEQGHGSGGVQDPHADYREEPEDPTSVLAGLIMGGETTEEDEDDEDEDVLKVFNLDEIIARGIKLNASDIHIIPGRKVGYRILGEMTFDDTWGEIPFEVTQRIQQSITTNVMDKDFVENLELDASYVTRTGKHRGKRLRVSIGKTFGDVYMVMRIINSEVKTPEELGIHPKVVEWSNLPNGLIMVNGPTGTGKSTTLASIIRKIQLERAVNIITVEKPVEFMYPKDGKAMIVQREVGRDTRTFSGALDSAMRQDPDIILIGEVRNTLEINQLLRAAETGHLAFSTMHTNSAPQTINRIKSLFEGNEQLRVLSTLADVTRGFVNQVLVKTKNGKGRVGVQEVLEVNKEISRMILEGDTREMRKYQEENRITMEHALVDNILKGVITAKDAEEKSAYPLYLKELLANEL